MQTMLRKLAKESSASDGNLTMLTSDRNWQDRNMSNIYANLENPQESFLEKDKSLAGSEMTANPTYARLET